MAISVVILSAGFGSRMKSKNAKALQPLLDLKLIDYALDKAFALSDDIHLVLHHQEDEIRKYIKDNYSKKLGLITFSHQDINAFSGTAAALFDIKVKYEDLIVLNVDMPLLDMKDLNLLANSKSPLALLAFSCERENSYGRVFLQEGKVAKIVEVKDANEEELNITLCNAGIYKFKASLLYKLLPLIKNENAQKEYYLTDSIALAKNEGVDMELIMSNEKSCLGINSKEELNKASEILRKKIIKRWLAEGIVFEDSKSTLIGSRVIFREESIIESNVRITGKTIIESSTILHSSSIDSSRIINSQIGPFSRIRPRCKIVDSQIGNFTECKNAKLRAVKASHHAYLGDCEIGRGTNIGCGAITCNYDGKEKHISIIGKDVFIGSNVNIIAPIKIPSQSFIAAGSTISSKAAKNLAAGDVFIERATGHIYRKR